MRWFGLAIAVFVLITPGSAGVFGQKPVRVSFKPGATTATVSGSLNGFKTERKFVIRVRAGQTLSTEQISGKPVTVWISTPSGESYDEDMDLSCHDRRQVQPTSLGDYILTLKECEKADPWKGSFRLRIKVR